MPSAPTKTRLLRFGYEKFAKPVFFAIDPEIVHDRMLVAGNLLGKTAPTRWLTKTLLDYKSPILRQTVAGIDFVNPMGLAAGFDKNASIVNILPSVGFGFAEIGSITKYPYVGNPAPRLTRLPKSRSIVVNYGLANIGVDAIAKRLERYKYAMPIGTSIAPTNSVDTGTCTAAVADCEYSYDRLKSVGSYTTLNLSCPNTGCDQPFMQPDWLEALLATVTKIQTKKPIFIKLSPDRPPTEINKLLRIAEKHGVAGIICTNLTKPRGNKKILDKNVPVLGGLSGKVVEDLSNNLITHIYKEFDNRFIIIGCGGVFTADDAYEKIQRGASLIQLITGMIYGGPQTIGEINAGLSVLLKKNGYSSIAEAVGTKSINN